eukprot:CAMPEP_0116544604 /NCGR_PEP_ID=MMETSP0397-20121206/2210_1 /TAXON_ID=216820 /ORGANISM="Cyclophora tenuis, Strain ECT3854" /LENGTH=188 /DNA_ID=CAMNT_0004068835 /DNA_START=6 /DNA_END=573 /DNA_ORIENTATION=-
MLSKLILASASVGVASISPGWWLPPPLRAVVVSSDVARSTNGRRIALAMDNSRNRDTCSKFRSNDCRNSGEGGSVVVSSFSFGSPDDPMILKASGDNHAPIGSLRKTDEEDRGSVQDSEFRFVFSVSVLSTPLMVDQFDDHAGGLTLFLQSMVLVRTEQQQQHPLLNPKSNDDDCCTNYYSPSWLLID